MPIFTYPRGLLAVCGELRRNERPPAWVGPIPGAITCTLKETLEAQKRRFSSRQLRVLKARIRIDLSRDGTRKVITGRRIWPTSIYPSRKCGAAVVCEGANELLFTHLCETDPGVTGFATQALRFQVQVDGSMHYYHADFVRSLRDGRIQVVEVKPDPSFLKKTGYKEKTDAVKAVCEELGWQFRAVFGEDLRRRTFFNFHVAEIHRYRFFHIRTSLQDAIVKRLRAGKGEITLGDLLRLERNQQEMRATLFALVCRGVLQFDLSRPVLAQSAFHLLDGRAA